MKTSYLITLLSLIGLCCFSSCQKEDGLIVDFVYDETQCADPWGNASDNQELRQLIENYLSEKGVEVASISFSAYDGLIYCAACSCPSGRDIELRASEAFTAQLEGLGFELQ